MCARLMRNGFAHITSSVTFKRDQKESHRKRRKKRRKKKNFLFFVLPPFSFESFFLSPFPPDLFILALLLLPDFLTSSERVQRKKERGKETKYANSRRASRETRPLSSPRRFVEEEKEQRDLIHFLITTSSSSPPRTLHLLRSSLFSITFNKNVWNRHGVRFVHDDVLPGRESLPSGIRV